MSYDVRLDRNMDLTIPSSFVEGEDLLVQKCRMRIETFRGEWILDSRYGQPWLEWVDQGVSDTDLTQIEDVLRVSLEEIEGVRRAAVTATTDDLGVISISITITLDSSLNPVVLDAFVSPDGTTRVRPALGGGIL